MSKTETAIEKRARLGAPLPAQETANATLAKQPTFNSNDEGEDAVQDIKIPWLKIIKGIGETGKDLPGEKGKFLLDSVVLGKKLNVIFYSISRYWLETFPPPYNRNNQSRRFMKLTDANAEGLMDQYSKEENYVVRAAQCVMAFELPEGITDVQVPLPIELGGKTYGLVKFSEKKKAYENGISPAVAKRLLERKSQKSEAPQYYDYTWTMENKDLLQNSNYVPTPHLHTPIKNNPEIVADLTDFLGKKTIDNEVPDDGN